MAVNVGEFDTGCKHKVWDSRKLIFGSRKREIVVVCHCKGHVKRYEIQGK